MNYDISEFKKINSAFKAVQTEYNLSSLKHAFDNYYDMPVNIRIQLIDIVIERAEKDIKCLICSNPIDKLEERCIGLLGQSHIACVEKMFNEPIDKIIINE